MNARSPLPSEGGRCSMTKRRRRHPFRHHNWVCFEGSSSTRKGFGGTAWVIDSPEPGIKERGSMTSERALFPELVDKQRGLMPEGFRYEEDIISEADEAALAKSLATLELKPFEFHGHLGNRRVTSFGLRYDYARHAVKVTDGFPAFVADLRNKVAKFAGRTVDGFQEGGVNEYPPGARIGWHKDKPQFGVTVGVSLLAP